MTISAVATTTAIRPFAVSVPEESLTDLRRRIAATRSPTRELVADASQGVQLEALRAVMRYWANEHDWRKCEARLNALPQFKTEVLACWLTQVNPLVDFALSDRGELTFANAAEQAGVASPASDYRIQWARFDNATGVATDAGEATVTEPSAQAPASLVSGGAAPEFIQVRIAATHPQFPAWSTPVTVHFKRTPRGWKLVGLVRLPDEGGATSTHLTKERSASRVAGRH